MEGGDLRLLCSGCGANLEYSAGMQALKCVYCGTVTEIPRAENDEVEGAPDQVVTLVVTRNQLEDAVFQHLAEGQYTPDNLLEHATFTKVEQFFVPAYAFSGTYEAQWTASFGYDRTEHYTDFVSDSKGNSRPVSRTRTVTDWRPVNGTDTGQFSVIAYGGARLQESPLNLAARLVERCRLASDVAEYSESFTSGFEVEAYSVPPKEAYAASGEALVNRVIDAGVQGHAQGDHQKDWHWKATTRKQTSRVLIPVCHVVYEFEGTSYNVWVDGTSTGNFVADAPPEDQSRRKAVRNGFLPVGLAALGAVATAAMAHDSPGPLPESPLLWIGLGGSLLYGLLRRHAILSYSLKLRQAILAQRKLNTSNATHTSDAEQLKLIEACKRPERPWLAGAIRDVVALPVVSVIALAAVLIPGLHDAINGSHTPPQDTVQAAAGPTPSATQTAPLVAQAPAAAPAVPASADVINTAAAGAQPVTAYPTSFDCNEARSDAEHLICGDAELAADDVELAGLYDRAKAAATDQQAFAQHVRQQWDEREQNCHDRGCVAQWYADQKAWFNSVLSGQQPGDTAVQQASGPHRTYLTSFICANATHPDERAICGDQDLAAMDIQMSEVFGAAMQRTINPDQLRAAQSAWRAQRRSCGSDTDCLRQAYGTRLEQLRQQP